MSQCEAESIINNMIYYCVKESGHTGEHQFQYDETDKEIDRLTRELAEAQAEIERLNNWIDLPEDIKDSCIRVEQKSQTVIQKLRAEIEAAPHDVFCAAITYHDDGDLTQHPTGKPCSKDCWKAEALKQEIEE